METRTNETRPMLAKSKGVAGQIFSASCAGGVAMSETFGERLRRLRTERNLSVAYVAERIGVTHSVIRKAEENWFQVRAHRLPTLAKMLGVTTDYLLTGHDPDDALRRAILTRAPYERLVAMARREV